MAGLEWFSLAVGGVGALLAALLALLSIIRRFMTWFDARADPSEAIRDTLIESGLIKPGAKSEVWPNGSDNLPDFLRHLWLSQISLQESIDGRRSKHRHDDVGGTPI